MSKSLQYRLATQGLLNGVFFELLDHPLDDFFTMREHALLKEPLYFPNLTGVWQLIRS